MEDMMDKKVIDKYGSWELVFDKKTKSFSINSHSNSIDMEVSETPERKLQVFASLKTCDWFDRSILEDYIKEMSMASEAMNMFQLSIDFYSYENGL